MTTVTRFVKSMTQPRGGFLPIKNFNTRGIYSNEISLASENIHPSVVGMAVDYLTRYRQGLSVQEAFKISMKGARLSGNLSIAAELLREIENDRDSVSIMAACKIVEFDVVYRTGMFVRPEVEKIPDKKTIEHISIMVENSCDYLNKLGGVVNSGFTFEGALKNSRISNGDGDFLTPNSLIDFKVSTNKPSSKETMQLFIYYLLGLRSINHQPFSAVEFLRIFNPRLGREWYVGIEDIPKDVTEEIIDLIYVKESEKS